MLFKTITIECEHCGKEFEVDVEDYFSDSDFLEELEDWELIGECKKRGIIKENVGGVLVDSDEDDNLDLETLSNKDKRHLIAKTLGLNNAFDQELVISYLNELYERL